MRGWEVGGWIYLVRIIQVHHPTPARRNILMALPLPAHGQRRIHVDIVTGEIQTDQCLEDDGVGGFGAGEKDQEAGGGAAVGDHVEDGAELGGLAEFAGGEAVEGVEEAGDGVEEGAAAGVQGHEVEGGEGEDDARISYTLSSITHFVLLLLVWCGAYRSSWGRRGRCSRSFDRLLQHRVLVLVVVCR